MGSARRAGSGEPLPGRSERFTDARSGQLNRAVIVTVIAVRVMEVAINQVVDMVAMRNCFMAAALAVGVGAGDRGAAIRIGLADLNDVFLNEIADLVMQVAIDQIVDVIAMNDGGVAAVRIMMMIVMRMVRHDGAPFKKRAGDGSRADAFIVCKMKHEKQGPGMMVVGCATLPTYQHVDTYSSRCLLHRFRRPLLQRPQMGGISKLARRPPA